MKCERIKELMSAYIDNEINEVDKAKFEKHIAQCPECKEEYELLLAVVNECSEIDEVELPEEFREELHNKLLQAKESKSRGLSDFIRRNKWRVYAGTAAAAVLIFALSLNGLNMPKSDAPMAQSTAPSMEAQKGKVFGTADVGAPNQASNSVAVAPEVTSVAPAPAPTVIQFSKQAGGNDALIADQTPNRNGDAGARSFTTAGPNAPSINAARKIIKNGNVYLKVNDVQGRINEITTMAEGMGGYIENSSVNDVSGAEGTVVPEGDAAKAKTTKVGSITIKVPADKFETTFQSLLNMGNVETQNTSVNDITKEYMDLESRMNNLIIQEKTYKDLLEKTKNVDEILRVETEINRIRTEIDIMQGDLKRWNDQVEYSTIYVNLTEVKEAELEKVDTSSVWHRARQGLINTLNNIKNGIAWLFVFLTSALPYIFILGAGSLLAVYWIRRRKK